MQPDVLVLACKSLQVLLALAGLPLNVYIFLSVIFSRLTFHSCLLLCLALSHLLFDMLVAASEVAAVLLSVPLFPAPILWMEHWPQLLHRLQAVVWVTVPLCHLWIICALVFDRYLLIVRPFRYQSKLNRWKATLLLILAGILLFASSLPLCPRFPLSPASGTAHLVLDLSQTLPRENLQKMLTCVSLFVVALLLPATVMLLCNSHLLWIILEHRNRIGSTIYVVQFNSARYRGEAVVDGCRLKHRRDVLLTSVHLFCTLALLLPYCAMLSGQLLFGYFNLHLVLLSQVLLCLTPLVNGYIYGWRSPPIKKAFYRVLQVRTNTSPITRTIRHFASLAPLLISAISSGTGNCANHF